MQRCFLHFISYGDTVDTYYVAFFSYLCWHIGYRLCSVVCVYTLDTDYAAFFFSYHHIRCEHWKEHF